MATTPADVGQRLDHDLQLMKMEAEYLPATAEEWDDLPESETIARAVEWDDVVLGFLPVVHQAHCAGQMTPEQEAKYQEVLALLRAAEPARKKLGFQPPSIPLEP